jgi:site-specific DNA-methyltransferase (adenine-specific)
VLLEVNRIYCKDCLDGLKGVATGSVGLILVDPPYEIGYTDWDRKGILHWLNLRDQFLRVLHRNGNLIIFQGWSNVAELIRELSHDVHSGLELKNWIIWDRIKGRGAKKNFMSTREDILWFVKKYHMTIRGLTKPEPTFNKIYSNTPKKTKGMGTKNGQANRSLSNVWTDISPIVPWAKERVAHPTQKPLQLIERLVTIFSNEGDLVLDCFSGSGTTAVACKNLNRNFICFDNNSEYCKIARKRLK